MKKPNITVYKYKNEDVKMVAIYDKTDYPDESFVAEVTRLYTHYYKGIILVPESIFQQVFKGLYDTTQKYLVHIPCGSRDAIFEATDIKAVEGGFFATIANSLGGASREMYYYEDGCFYEEVKE